MKNVLVLLGLFIFLLEGAAFAQEPPNTIYYHKTLTSALTTSKTTVPVPVTFSLWDAATGGNELWSETKDIQANKATRLITTNLGDTNPISETDLRPQMWVEVYANGQQYGSRGLLTAAPYALFENVMTDSNYNTAVGINAFQSNTTGIDNTATGWGTLYSNTTGRLNTANGSYAL